MRSWELNGLNILINYTERAIFYPHPGSFENFPLDLWVDPFGSKI